MKPKRTLGNHILIRLDKENDFIKLKDGGVLYVDTTFDPEKHATVTGEVFGVPSKLHYSGQPNKGMPWKTPMEIRIGDRVVVYYLAVVNSFRKESYKAIIEDDGRYVFVTYQSVYAVIREGQIIPVNGYCLIEPVEDPGWTRTKARIIKAGLVPLPPKEKSLTDVTFGRVKYMGRPNEEYVDKYSDEGVGVNVGDVVVMRRITDLPLEYDLHARIDGGRKYWRVQRKNILAVL